MFIYLDIDITILLLIFLTYIDYLKYLMRSKMPSQKILFFFSLHPAGDVSVVV